MNGLRIAGLVLGGLCLQAAIIAGEQAGEDASDTTAKTLSTRWMSAYNSGDIAQLVAVYDSDARVQHGYCAPVHGREAIEKFWQSDVAEGAPQTELRVEDSFEAEDVVYLSGYYRVADEKSEASPTGGTFIQIWRREAGAGWLLFRESWVNLACVDVETKPQADELPPGIGIAL